MTKSYKVIFPDDSVRECEPIGHTSPPFPRMPQPIFDIPGYEVEGTIDGRFFAFEVPRG